MKNKGILLDESLNFVVKNGGLVIGDITRQNQKVLILSNKGELKENPKRGIGALRFVEEASTESLAREIRIDFNTEGMKIDSIQITDDFKTVIDAKYEG